MSEIISFATAVAFGVLIWKTTVMVFWCSRWAIHDTLVVANNLKPNLSAWTIVKGLTRCYCHTFFSTFVDRLSGTERHT